MTKMTQIFINLKESVKKAQNNERKLIRKPKLSRVYICMTSLYQIFYE